MFELHPYYLLLQQNRIFFSYRGILDGEIINGLLRMVERKLILNKEYIGVRKKLINLLVESLQNIFNYFSDESIEKDHEDESFLVLLKEEDGYRIFTGNYISTQRARALKKRLDNVNLMSEEDLRDIYVSILENPKTSLSGGAGLGFIDMARKSGNRIEYEFYPHNEEYMLFTMRLWVGANSNTQKVGRLTP